ncbi:hypothetical protein SORBI_3001G342800 [Sorghum bicolor]|uniref:Uncharacterized protein n=1 Tax=Sorghum bicolor TaxID=4558 RepID=A0A1B6QMP3_SORBI|nr:hypothetical protein SORBI_3001G342800 [Sorghum bicolor]OQU92419.1 hypothetical protein SORBI_3001G342800 [Sorghum bicolor]OQU92420.1 hypothetical protein SORBI_3001G342800 [Sorghum bicolor]OQU92421.1 hypothetical protein SORBI_3001G342800 [Sorghum bicolor]OQU92422.1 hypothetical protein SORBI_3001G342800 [Sorghum bicolor]
MAIATSVKAALFSRLLTSPLSFRPLKKPDLCRSEQGDDTGSTRRRGRSPTTPSIPPSTRERAPAPRVPRPARELLPWPGALRGGVAPRQGQTLAWWCGGVAPRRGLPHTRLQPGAAATAAATPPRLLVCLLLFP